MGKKAQSLRILVAIIAVFILIGAVYLIFSFYPVKKIKPNITENVTIGPVIAENVTIKPPITKNLSSPCELAESEKCCKWFIEHNNRAIEDNCKGQRLFITYILLENKPELCNDYEMPMPINKTGVSGWLTENQAGICSSVFQAYNNPDNVKELNDALIAKCLESTGQKSCNSLDIGTNFGLIVGMAVKNIDASQCNALKDTRSKSNCMAIVMNNQSLCAECT